MNGSRAFSTPSQYGWATVVVAAFAAFAAVLWLHMGAYAGGADSSGYLNSARLLSRGHARTAARRISGIPDGRFRLDAYVPLGFRPSGAGAVAPIYPVGFPLLLAGVARIAGWLAAPGATMLLHSLLGLALVFWLARECGLSPNVAAAAAFLLATSPLYLFMSLQLMSDVPALVWTTAAVLFAWRSRRDQRWAIPAGVALSVAVLVRPTNIVAVAPIALCLGTSTRRWLALIAAGLPGALFLGVYNRAAYGHALATGYQGLENNFSSAFVAASLRNYATWLPVLATPAGVLAAALPTLRRRRGPLPAVLLAWIAVYLAAYACYMFTQQTWWFLRFLLPAFPAFIAGGLWVGCAWLERWKDRIVSRGRFAAASVGATFVTLTIVHSLAWTAKLGVLDIGRGERVYPEVSAWANAHMPGNAAIVAMQVSGALFYYTRFPIVRWDDFDGDSLRRLENEASGTGHTLYAMLFPFEREALLPFLASSPHPGRWTEIGAVRDVTIWRLDTSPDR